MKLFLFTLLCICNVVNITAQCSTLVVMEKVILDGCTVMPRVISSGEYLFTCDEPDGFNQLEAGDTVFIDYVQSGCANFCQFGSEVDVTCFEMTVGIEDQETADDIKVFPTLVESHIYFEGNDIIQIEVYNDRGVPMMNIKEPEVFYLDVVDLGPGVYFIRVITNNGIEVKKIVKL